MAPLVKELEKHKETFQSIVCVTAQHREMLDQVMNLFEINADYDFDLMRPGQDLFDITCGVLSKLKLVMSEVRPELVLIHGDTTTTMAAALAAFYCKIPIGHVEAGLRTGNVYAPFPEELNRRIAGIAAVLHFAPTENARQNLLREGVPTDTIFVTGNTVIDALLVTVNKIKKENLCINIVANLVSRFPSLQKVLLSDSSVDKKHSPRLILVTGHRRENFGIGFENICHALKKIAEAQPRVEIVYPVHLNPNVQEPVQRILGNCPNVHLMDPLDYLPFVYLMDRSYLIITDSGGVQEEAPSLGKPVLLMRDTTERPEAVNSGLVKLVGTNQEIIEKNVVNLLNSPESYKKMVLPKNPYGDGTASAQIVNIVKRWSGGL